MPRCPLCFQEKALVPPPVKNLPEMCKGCFYKLDQMLGYLKFYGHGIQAPLIPPQTPPDQNLGASPEKRKVSTEKPK